MPATAVILVVEDNIADVTLLREALKECGSKARLISVHDADHALTFLRKEGEFKGAPTPHLILLDLNLPGRHGLELLTQIKEVEALRTIPVAVLTTSSYDKEVATAYRKHVNAFIIKPSEFSRFVEIVRAIVEFWLKVNTLPAS